MYQENSLENDTHESKGSGHTNSIKKLEDFLRANNKTELFKMLADVVNCECEEGIVLSSLKLKKC